MAIATRAVLRAVTLAAAVAACGGDENTGDPAAADDPTADANPSAGEYCDVTVELVGAISATPTEFPELEVPADGASVCTHLDGRQIARSHFAANTANEPGPQSSFHLALSDSDGNPLRDGSDVTIGETEPMTFANLEWVPWQQDVPQPDRTRDVVLRIVPRSGLATSTDLALFLFDPLE